MTTIPQPSPPPARGVFFAAVAILIGTAAGLLIVEYGLRYHASVVRSREHMDPGLLVFDPELGWTMSPNWSGAHSHHDFQVRYTTGDMGLRGHWGTAARRVAFVGDSFTFGLGVNDGETFVALLDAGDPGVDYLNAGVAGYSTDQQYLYLQRRLPDWEPDHLALVLYLGNDVLDNTLAYPLQADMAKPLYRIVSDRLQLTNVPVPRLPKSIKPPQPTMATMILGDEAAGRIEASWRSRWQLARRLGLNEPGSLARDARFDTRLRYPLEVSVRLIEAIGRIAHDSGAGFGLVLLPGRSYVEDPGGLSAAFQDYVRLELLSRVPALGVDVIDLTGALGQAARESPEPLFHPNEGHLSPAGHRVVASTLRSALDRPGLEPRRP